tara:strand:+ start:12985 stop:14115 length:1131 start_codon:yes stop_codon:yes gene_type:complete
MILFLTQYYSGLGHSMRIKHIAEETAKFTDCCIVNHLFKPPLEIKGIKKEYTLVKEEDYDHSEPNIFKALMKEPLVIKRIARWKNFLNDNNISVIVSEGFPFCRHQWAFELFSFFEAAKAKGIKIICSIRDFPWDEPHEQGLKDWVAKTQNLVVNQYLDKILIHGDPKILPLLPDSLSFYDPALLYKEIESKIEYTGYVTDPKQEKHKRLNNKVYVSVGLNKEESLSIFSNILRAAKEFPELDFIVLMANKKLKDKIGIRKKSNILAVDYIPNLSRLIESSTMFITYGGYNSTMEILSSRTPSIIIPREDGGKVEQFVRSYVMKPYDLFKVCSVRDLKNISKYIREILNEYDEFPKNCEFDLDGTRKTAKILLEYN